MSVFPPRRPDDIVLVAGLRTPFSKFGEQCARRYITYRLSYRDLVAVMAEQGIVVSHTTSMRWVLNYVPECERRWARDVGVGIHAPIIVRAPCPGQRCPRRLTATSAYTSSMRASVPRSMHRARRHCSG